MAFKDAIKGEDLKGILEGVNKDSTEDFDTTLHNEQMCALKDIHLELKKLNMYFALITKTRL